MQFRIGSSGTFAVALIAALLAGIILGWGWSESLQNSLHARKRSCIEAGATPLGTKLGYFCIHKDGRMEEL